MTAVSPLAFPGGRTLAGWWKHLGRLQPRALWVGYLLLHRVEALVASHLLLPLEPFSLFVLRTVALTGTASLQEVEQRLHLGLPLLRQLLRHLERENLVRPEVGETWSLTVVGQQGLEQGSYRRLHQERRVFYFVEKEHALGPPHFLNLRSSPAALAGSGVDGWRFEPELLQACVGRPVGWKQQFGFPLDVEHVLDSGAPGETSPVATEAWRRIIVDRPERLVAALVVVPADEKRERLLGFAVRLEGWVLESAEPAFIIDRDWQEVFPELAAELSLDQWQQAWRAWCQPRGLPAAEVNACILERQGCRLRVTAAPRLVERLRAARSDVFKGEAWVVAGAGRLRPAAQVELVEMKREGTGPSSSANV